MIRKQLKMSTTAGINISTNNTVLVFSDSQWIGVQVITAIEFVFSVWVFLSFLVYGIRTRKWKNDRRSNRLERWIYFFAILSGLFLVFRLIVAEATILVGFNLSNSDCEISCDASTVSYLLSLAPAYLCLWLRQKALYADKCIVDLRSRVIIVLNWMCLVLIVGSLISACGLFVYFVSYKASSRGCVRIQSNDNIISSMSVIIVAALLVIGQFMLLGLLIYPLRQYAKKNYSINLICVCCTCQELEDVDNNEAKRKSYDATSSNVSEPSASHTATQPTVNTETNFPRKAANRATKARTGTKRRLMKIMQRSVIFAVTCIAADILATAIEPAYSRSNPGNPHIVSNAIFDVSLIVRVIALLMQFDCRREIAKTLFVWPK